MKAEDVNTEPTRAGHICGARLPLHTSLYSLPSEKSASFSSLLLQLLGSDQHAHNTCKNNEVLEEASLLKTGFPTLFFKESFSHITQGITGGKKMLKHIWSVS